MGSMVLTLVVREVEEPAFVAHFYLRHGAPGLSVDLRWAINDWSKEIPAEINVGNYSSVISGGVYRARVPVEKYDVPGQIAVHFFAGGKARVVAGWPIPVGLDDEILPSNSHVTDLATSGQPVNEMFTKEEHEAMRRREAEHKRKYGEDWK